MRVLLGLSWGLCWGLLLVGCSDAPTTQQPSEEPPATENAVPKVPADTYQPLRASRPRIDSLQKGLRTPRVAIDHFFLLPTAHFPDGLALWARDEIVGGGGHSNLRDSRSYRLHEEHRYGLTLLITHGPLVRTVQMGLLPDATGARTLLLLTEYVDKRQKRGLERVVFTLLRYNPADKTYTPLPETFFPTPTLDWWLPGTAPEAVRTTVEAYSTHPPVVQFERDPVRLTAHWAGYASLHACAEGTAGRCLRGTTPETAQQALKVLRNAQTLEWDAKSEVYLIRID